MSLAAALLAAAIASTSVADNVPELLRRPAWQEEPDLAVHPADAQAQPSPRAAALRRRADPEDDPRAWTGTDTALEAAVGLSLLGDYLQTRRITRDGRESNPVIGRRGGRVPPEVYFPAVLGLHALAARALPRPWRTLTQGALLGMQGAAIHHNLQAGYGFRF